MVLKSNETIPFNFFEVSSNKAGLLEKRLVPVREKTNWHLLLARTLSEGLENVEHSNYLS